MGAGPLGIGRLHQVAQKASDLRRSVEFYGVVLGLELIATFDPPGLAFVRLGDTRLMLEGSAPRPRCTSGWTTSVRRSTSCGGGAWPFEDEPRVIFRDDEGRFGAPGQEEWMTFFRDPDGNLLALASRR